MGTPWENGDLYGKLTVCHGKSPFLMGKSTTVSRVIFNSYVKLPEGILYIRMYVGHPSRNGNPSSEYIEYLTPFTIFKSISMDQ